MKTQKIITTVKEKTPKGYKKVETTNVATKAQKKPAVSIKIDKKGLTININ